MKKPTYSEISLLNLRITYLEESLNKIQTEVIKVISRCEKERPTKDCEDCSENACDLFDLVLCINKVLKKKK